MNSEHLSCESCSLKSNNLFQCVKPKFLQDVSISKETKFYKKGSCIFKAGDEATHFFCIRSGHVRTFKSNHGGREQTFLIKSEGDWVGCRDVIIDNQYNYTAICMDDVVVCSIPKQQMKALNSEPNFQAEMIKEMAKSWRDSEERIYSLGTKQIHSKLAEFLLMYYRSNDCQEELTLPITREVIASIIGTTTESVIRALSDFKAREWINLEKNRISFRNIAALTSISELEHNQIVH